MERKPTKQTRTAAFSTIGAFALAVALFASPASATGSRNHDGHADRGRSTSYTEDNDTNDGGTPNNVADDGDNRHPSGNDRSVEHGGSGNQGRSQSDPDDDGHGPDRSNGGPDKPNGSGGVDMADQDGNNGCGNDDDFEDDNEGWCGHKPEKPENERGGRVEATPVSDHDDADETDKPDHEGRNGRSADQCERDADAAEAHGQRAHDEAVAVVETDKPDHDSGAGAQADETDKPDHDSGAQASEHGWPNVADRCEDRAEAGATNSTHDERDDADDDDDATGVADEADEADDDDDDDDDADMAAAATDDDDDADMAAAATDDDAAVLSAGLTSGAPAAAGEVLAMEAVQPTGGAAGAELASSSPDAAVLSSGLVASVAASSLAFTGDHIMQLMFVALLALAIGWALVRQSRHALSQS